MKNKELSIAINCYYIVISFVIVFLLALCVLYLPNIREIDLNILHFIQSCLFTLPISAAEFISNFGASDCWLWPKITVASVLFSHKYYMRAFLFVFITKLVYFFNDSVVKLIVCRERPCSPITLSGFSFPSGHMACVTCLLGIVIYLIHRNVKTDWWRTLFVTLFSIWIVLVGISRMWLNVHFFTDVTAGFFVGLAFVNLYIILDKFFNAR